MEIFAIVCLVVIVLALQHVVNWMWRSVKDSEEMTAAAVVTVAILGGTLILVIKIIEWGAPLI